MFIESEVMELKREYTDDIKRTVVAFLNTSGGTIIIGVNDDGNVVGVENIDHVMKQVTQSSRNSIKPDITMFFKVSCDEIDGKSVVKISALPGSDKPYYLADKGLKPSGVLVRVGPATVPSGKDHIRSMIKLNDYVKYTDGLSIEQDLSFNFASEVFAENKVSFDKNKYLTLGLTRQEGPFTNLALLLSDQCAHTIKVAIFEGKTKSIFRDRKEFDGSIFKQLQDVYSYIDFYNRTNSTFQGLKRNDKRDYPELAIREVLLNAVVHREYSFSGSTLVNLYDDRLEVVTLGGVVEGLSLDSIMQGVSQTRNENLAKVFYRIKFVEAYGTGIPRIMEEYKNCPNKPKIEVSDSSFKVILPNMNYAGNIAEKIKFEERYKVELTDQERDVLNLIKSSEGKTRKEVIEFTKLSATRAYEILKKLVDIGELTTLKKGKEIFYR